MDQRFMYILSCTPLYQAWVMHDSVICQAGTLAPTGVPPTPIPHVIHVSACSSMTMMMMTSMIHTPTSCIELEHIHTNLYSVSSIEPSPPQCPMDKAIPQDMLV